MELVDILAIAFTIAVPLAMLGLLGYFAPKWYRSRRERRRLYNEIRAEINRGQSPTGRLPTPPPLQPLPAIPPIPPVPPLRPSRSGALERAQTRLDAARERMEAQIAATERRAEDLFRTHNVEVRTQIQGAANLGEIMDEVNRTIRESMSTAFGSPLGSGTESVTVTVAVPGIPAHPGPTPANPAAPKSEVVKAPKKHRTMDLDDG